MKVTTPKKAAPKLAVKAASKPIKKAPVVIEKRATRGDRLILEEPKSVTPPQKKTAPVKKQPEVKKKPAPMVISPRKTRAAPVVASPAKKNIKHA